MTAEPLSNLDRSTLRERALEALRSAITSGQYRPGDHLSEVPLASHLGVSRGTVKIHVQHIISKLGVSDRTQAAVRAIEAGIL